MKMIDEWSAELQRQISRPATAEELLELENLTVGMFDQQKADFLAMVRADRERILARLNGYAGTLMLKEPPENAEEKTLCVAVIQGLLDITTIEAVTSATTFAQLKAAVKAEYARLVHMASPDMVKAFRSVDL